MKSLFERPQFWRGTAVVVALVALGCMIGALRGLAAAAASPTSVSQIPLTIVIPAHPQIVLAVGNSQSMDGDLSGAIYTGSGSLGTTGGLALLQNSSSPVNYTVPSDFTPPLVGPNGLNQAPYTVQTGSTLYDNSASRLNVAKAGITAILQAYAGNADFALMDYSTSGVGTYTTWVYYMSPASSGFQFQSTPNPTTATNPTVNSPCYNYKSLSSATAVFAYCYALDGHYYSSCAQATTTCGLNSLQYMVIGASSDAATISDVLYSGGGVAPLCLAYGTVSPASPYTYSYGQSTPLVAYEVGAVYESYSKSTNSCATTTGPTNAGYVPFSPEVMYAERGYGYYSSEQANSGNLVVGMTGTGQNPTAALVTNVVNKFAPYLAPETNVASTNEIKALAVQSPIAGIIKQSGTYLQSGLSTSDGCKALQYVVLVTDGLPTEDLSGHNWPPLGSVSASAPPNGFGVSASFNADGSLATTNDTALNDAITQIAALKAAGIKTYVIGLGAAVADPTGTSMAAQTLTAMAVAGGTKAYFPAVSASALVSDMQVILAQILGESESIGSVAVNSTGLNTSTVVYQSQFVPSNTYQDWTGDLFAYPVNATTGAVATGAANAIWSAATQLDLIPYTNRLIATWDPVVGKAIPFEWDTSGGANDISINSVLGQDLETFTPDTSGADVLAYLRGNTAQEQRNGGQFRNRTHILGDIVNSSPVYIGPASSASQDPSYLAFAQSYSNRPGTLYVGANDGMLHAFSATTGSELYAFIPNGVYSNLIKLVNPFYGPQHLFYVNGSPQASDVKFNDGTWHTLLVSGEGQGGNTVFAMDVTNPAAITNEAQLSASVLWEFSDVDMGLSMSTPAMGNTADGFVVFFGNGYNSVGQKPVLYAVDPKSGATLAKIDLCAQETGVCNAGLANGLSSVSVVNNGGQLAGPANVVYAGDLQGNMWRVDVSNASPSLWTATVLFQARDALGNPQPITEAPVVSLNPRYPQLKGTMVFFGTGQLLGIGDLGNTQVQTIYGVFDSNTASATPLTRSSLVQQVMTTGMVGSVMARFITTTNPVSLPSVKGWYIDLNIVTGERSLTEPSIEAGGALVLTTYQPNSNLCTGGGNAYLLVINYATGGSFTVPQIDVNGDGTVNSQDTSGTQGNPIGMFLASGYAAGAVVRTCASTTSSDCIEVGLSNGQIDTIHSRGTSRQRTSWWEIR